MADEKKVDVIPSEQVAPKAEKLAEEKPVEEDKKVEDVKEDAPKDEPKEVPNKIARYSKRESELSEIPNKDILDRTKNPTKITRVHFNLTLKLTFFSVGARTSGKLCNNPRNPMI